jgi:hypothetical protein
MIREFYQLVTKISSPGRKARTCRSTDELFQEGFPLPAKMRRSNTLHAVPAFKYDKRTNWIATLVGTEKNPWQ